MVKETDASIVIEEKHTLVKCVRKSAILRNSEVTKYYKSIFDQCDVNKDGFVSTFELRKFITGDDGIEIPKDVVKQILSSFDKDHDERLNFHEFLDLINDPKITRTFSRIGSRYLKYIEVSAVRKSVALKRTLTNTGLYEEEYSFGRHTLAMIMISVVQIVFFFIDKVYASKININHKPIADALTFYPTKKNEIWRYFGYILVHGSEAHLFGNVLLQILLGMPLEMVHCWRVPVIYVTGAFGGCLVHSVIARRSLIGGSGGVYAFYTAHLATVILNWREMSHPFVHLFIFGIMTIFDAIHNYITYGTMKQISYVTHLGGAVFGFLLGVLILRNLKSTKVEKGIWYTCLSIFVMLMGTFIILNVVLDGPKNT